MLGIYAYHVPILRLPVGKADEVSASVFKILPGNPQFLHFRLESRALEAESGSGAARSRDDSAGLAQNSQDVVPFRRVQARVAAAVTLLANVGEFR
jgi:hypothetical protein